MTPLVTLQRYRIHAAQYETVAHPEGEFYMVEEVEEMVATKATELQGLDAGEGCLAKAAMEEPIFILRANDRTSSKTVRAWVQAARDAGCTNEEKLQEALEWAVAAEKWREARGGGKVPD